MYRTRIRDSWRDGLTYPKKARDIAAVAWALIRMAFYLFLLYLLVRYGVPFLIQMFHVAYLSS